MEHLENEPQSPNNESTGIGDGRLDFDPTQIRISRDDGTIGGLIRRITVNHLDLSPPFQRKINIWSEGAQSRLIESLLLRIPIPAFYFDAREESKWVVIDGVQRLTAIARFVLDENMLKENLGSEIKQLKLCELEILRDLGGKTYNDLEFTLQSRLLETEVTLYTISPGTPANVKYNIFKRINTGGVLLSPQEIRNAFNAEATGFLDSLATSDEFLIATNWRVKDLRREDQEYVLRFIAFTLSSYEEYENQDFDQFLRGAMVKIIQMSPDDRDKCEETFKNAMSTAHQIFGTDAFCKANAGKYLDEIDPALFEMWAVHLGQLSDDDRELLSERKEHVTHQFRDLLLNDTNLCEVSTPNQESPERLKQRFETVGDFINDMLRTEDPWENIEAKYPIGSAVTGKVVEVHPTRVKVELEKDVQSFIETSELWETIGGMDDEILRYGDKINLVVLDIDEALRDISLSLKQHVEDKYEFGSMVEAKIVKLVPLGAIAELEKGVVGLIPGNNISSAHGNPELHINDTVMVLVLVIRNQNIVLSYKWHTQKQHSEQVWKSLSEKYPVGSEIRGQIVGMVPFGAFVELEDGFQGLIPHSELSWTKRSPKPGDFFNIGDEIDVKVLKIDPKEQRITLSYKRTKQVWKSLSEKYPVGSEIRGQIVGMVPFGAFVELEDGFQGLIPHSELSWTKRSPKPGDFFNIGDEIDVKVLKIDPEEQRITFSYKRTKPDPWTSVSEKYSIDSVVRGKIVNITDSGAFVELEDGIEGWIPHSELSWTKRSPKPGDFFDIGDEIDDVKVLKINPKKRRITLSYKRTKPDPWEEKYPINSVVRGKIVNITDYGAFAELEDGLQGLIHRSELSWTKRSPKPGDFFDIGDEIDVVVLDIDPKKRRIDLSYKRTKPDPWTSVSQKYPIDSVVRGKIVDITNYGAFAELEDGIRGLIHKSKLAPGLVKRVEDVVSVGDELALKVIDLDVNHRRIGLSLKAVDNQPTLLASQLREELNRAASEKVNDSPPTKQQSEGGT